MRIDPTNPDSVALALEPGGMTQMWGGTWPAIGIGEPDTAMTQTLDQLQTAAESSPWGIAMFWNGAERTAYFDSLDLE